MNYSLIILKKAFLSAAILSLLIFISCKREAVEPIPDIEIDPGDAFTEPEPIDEANPDNITAETIDFTPGDVDINGTENFDPASDPAGAIQDANALDDVLTAADEAFWQNLTPAQILALIESGDTQLINSLSQLLVAFQNDPRLSKFVPTVINPSVTLGRLSSTASSSSLPSSTPVQAGVNASQAAQQESFDDCIAAIEQEFQQLRAPLDEQLQEQLDIIETRYNTELTSLQTERDALINSAQARYESDRDLYLSEYNRIDGSIQTAFGAGAITDTERQLLILLNKIIYGLNVLASFDLLSTETDLINQGFQQGVQELNGERDAEEQVVRDSFQEQLDILIDQRNEAQLLCHNQGGSSGG